MYRPLDLQLLEGLNQNAIRELDEFIAYAKENRLPARNDELFYATGLEDIMIRVTKEAAKRYEDYRTASLQSHLLFRFYSEFALFKTDKTRTRYAARFPHNIETTIMLTAEEDIRGIIFEAYLRTVRKFRKQWNSEKRRRVFFSEYGILNLPSNVGRLIRLEMIDYSEYSCEPAYDVEYDIPEEPRFPNMGIKRHARHLGLTTWSLMRYFKKYPGLRPYLVSTGYWTNVRDNEE